MLRCWLQNDHDMPRSGREIRCMNALDARVTGSLPSPFRHPVLVALLLLLCSAALCMPVKATPAPDTASLARITIDHDGVLRESLPAAGH